MVLNRCFFHSQTLYGKPYKKVAQVDTSTILYSQGDFPAFRLVKINIPFIGLFSTKILYKKRPTPAQVGFSVISEFPPSKILRAVFRLS